MVTTPPTPRSLPAFLLLLIAVAALVVPLASSAAAATSCDDVTAQIGTDLKAIAPTAGQKLNNTQLQTLQKQAAAIFTNAAEQHPACENAISRYQAQLAAAARQKGQIKGTPFLGPIGWAWNNVYYKVFSGNDIMMGLFGWALLLSPFILVFSLFWVMKGSQGAFHRPYVPPHLRTEQ